MKLKGPREGRSGRACRRAILTYDLEDSFIFRSNELEIKWPVAVGRYMEEDKLGRGEAAGKPQ